MDFDCIIIGAGASGLMCAFAASRRGRRVLLVDHRRRFAQKLLAAGGGRCNFTNLDMDHRFFFSGNPHFVKSALARFGPNDFLSMLDERGIAYEERAQGRMFLRGSSRQILEMLLSGARASGARVEISGRCGVERGEGFVVSGAFGRARAPRLVVATGGLSYPDLGSSDLGHRIARQFRHRVAPCRPGLVPLVLGAGDGRIFSGLAGISFRAGVLVGKRRIEEDCLITHRGLSGPAILRASLLWREGEPIVLDLLPSIDLAGPLEEKRRGGSRMQLCSLLSRHLSGRLARSLCERLAPSRPINSYSGKELSEICKRLHSIELRPVRSEGYGRAEVTAGGVETRDISSRDMESKICPGLHFTGEVMDVTGDLGGYNLHWAWASAHAAAEAV